LCELDAPINVHIWSHFPTWHPRVQLNQALADKAQTGAAGAAPPEAIVALTGHPDFPEAARRSARAAIEMHRSERLVGWILSDRARAVFGHMALYLHATRDEGDPRSGLTASRLKDLAVETGLCSAGRAAAMLGLMRAARLVIAAPGEADRRVKRLLPTERMLDLVRIRTARQFEAVAPLLPEAERALALIHDTGFAYALVRALGDYFTAGFRILAHTPGLSLFAERDSGMIILFSLLLAGEGDGAFPPAGPVPVSIAETARRFGVSRTHVLRLLREAEAAGLLSRSGARGDAIVLHPRVIGSAMNFFAVIFLYLNSAARAALAEFEAGGRQRSR